MDQNQNNQEQNNQNDATSSFETFYQSDFSSDYTPPPPPKPSNSYAVASLILGIISIVLCCCCPPAIILTASLAIIFAILSRKGQPMTGKAIGGMICGIVSLFLSLLVIIAYIFSFANMTEEEREIFYDSFYEGFEQGFEEGFGNNDDFQMDDEDDQLPFDQDEPQQDTQIDPEKQAEAAAAANAAAPVIEMIRVLSNWPTVTEDNYERLLAQYVATVTAYDALDKQAKNAVGSDNLALLNKAKTSLKAYEDMHQAEASEQEQVNKLNKKNKIVKATVTIDGIMDNAVAAKSDPLILTKELCTEWNKDADLNAIGAGMVGDISMADDADTIVSFYFAYDDQYLYVTEERCDLTWLFTSYDFRKPFAGDGSLIWFTRGENATAPICGIQWNAGLRISPAHDPSFPGKNVPVLGLFSQDNQIFSAQKNDTSWKRALRWDDDDYCYVMEVRIPLRDLGFTAADIEAGRIGATLCSVDIVNETFDGNSTKLWTGYGYQMQYPGVNNWKWCYRLESVK